MKKKKKKERKVLISLLLSSLLPGFWLLSGSVMVNANRVGPTSGSYYKVINLGSQQFLAAMPFDLAIAKKLGRALILCQLNSKI